MGLFAWVGESLFGESDQQKREREWKRQRGIDKEKADQERAEREWEKKRRMEMDKERAQHEQREREWERRRREDMDNERARQEQKEREWERKKQEEEWKRQREKKEERSRQIQLANEAQSRQFRLAMLVMALVVSVFLAAMWKAEKAEGQAADVMAVERAITEKREWERNLHAEHDKKTAQMMAREQSMMLNMWLAVGTILVIVIIVLLVAAVVNCYRGVSVTESSGMGAADGTPSGDGLGQVVWLKDEGFDHDWSEEDDRDEESSEGDRRERGTRRGPTGPTVAGRGRRGQRVAERRQTRPRAAGTGQARNRQPRDEVDEEDM